MHLELRGGVSQCGERGDNGDFTAAQIQPRPGVNVAEREFDQVTGEIRCDVGQAVDDAFAGFTVDFPEFCQAALEAIRSRLMGLVHGVSFLMVE